MLRRLTLVLVLSVFSLVAQGQGQPLSDTAALLAEVDRLAAESPQTSQNHRILALLERALLIEPDNYQVLWRATRACYQVGDEVTEEETRAAYFERGIAVGQRAVAQQPAGVEGHFWLGANYGGLSELRGMLKALQLVKKIRSAMQTVLQLQPGYAHGDAYRALGEIERQVPAMLGGSLKRALAYLEQGRQIAPKNLAMKLALARAYRDAERDQESRQLLNEILRTPVRPEQAPADRAIHHKARQLLAD